jgi:hypothetical protein
MVSLLAEPRDVPVVIVRSTASLLDPLPSTGGHWSSDFVAFMESGTWSIRWSQSFSDGDHAPELVALLQGILTAPHLRAAFVSQSDLGAYFKLWMSRTLFPFADDRLNPAFFEAFGQDPLSDAGRRLGRPAGTVRSSPDRRRTQKTGDQRPAHKVAPGQSPQRRFGFPNQPFVESLVPDVTAQLAGRFGVACVSSAPEHDIFDSQ